MKNPPPPEWDGVEHLKSKSHTTQVEFSMSVGKLRIDRRGAFRVTAERGLVPCHLLTTS